MTKKRAKAMPKVDPYLEGLMGKLLDRLTALEKKMDAVLARTGKPAAGAVAVAAPPPPPRRERQLYEAICADCAKVCEVPFRPSENRPVYCKDCWAKRKAGGKGSQFPVLTPVALPPKPVSKLGAAPPPVPAPSAPAASPKRKKAPGKPAKKKKKK